MGKLKDTYWPEMTTVAVAENSVENAARVSYIVAGLTALLSLLAWFDVIHVLSPWSIINAILFAIIGLFIGRGSRVATVLGLVLYLVEALDKLLSMSSGSVGSFSVVMVFVTLFFINGVR